MDDARFDSLTRSLTTARSRRRALGSLLAGTLVLLGVRSQQVAAHDTLRTCKKKSGDAKRKCLKKARKHTAQHANEAPPPPPGPTCSDRVKNGNETDVDCGGSCGPCANEQRCLNFTDCQSAACAPNGTCQSCTELAGECPADRHGGCQCGTGSFGQPEGVCASIKGTLVATCDSCPPESIGCFSAPLSGPTCQYRCGTI
jgi:hypothetical protein